MSDINFSIILPTYNRKDALKTSIKSVLSQTYQNFELIIVDDGSTDGTGTFISEQYSKELKNEKIKFITTEHNGVSRARNIGLEKAQYDWIAYIDSDNEIYPNFLETFVQTIESNPQVKIFYAQFKKIFVAQTFGQQVCFNDCLQHNCIDLGVFIHHKSLYQYRGGFDEALTRLVDWDLILRYIKNNKAIFIAKEIMAYNDNMARKDRITIKEDYYSNYYKILQKHSEYKTLYNPYIKKETTMKLRFLKFIRFFHLISKEDYNKKRHIELVKRSPLFDDRWYLIQYPEFRTTSKSAAEHYVTTGWKEGKNPGPEFDTNEYLSNFPELWDKNLCPLAHYMIGRKGLIKPATGEKLKYILTYPIRVKEEYDALKAELKALESK